MLKKLRPYIAIFCVPLAVYLLVMITQGIYPFGEYSLLYQDAFDQYTSILQCFMDWLSSGAKGTVLWESGLGTDIAINMFYYGMSPLNIIIYIMGASHMDLSMTIVIVLKTCLLAPAALYFFRHTYANAYAKDMEYPKLKASLQFVFALAYALCGYVIAYNHNIIWMDGLTLLPFIALAVERLAKGEWLARYVVLLALSFIFNFYFTVYIAVFIICYFILQNHASIKTFAKGVVRFAGASLLSALMAAVVIVPAFYAVLHTSDAGNSDYTVAWNTVSSMGEFLASFYPLNAISTSFLFSHNNYCGAFALFFALVFLFTNALPKSTRIKYAAVVAFLVAGLNVAGLNYVLHGFVVPHGLGNRFAFVLTFVVLVMGYVAALGMKSSGIGAVAAAAGFLLVAYALDMVLSTEKSSAESYMFYLFLLVMYIFVAVFALRKSIKWTTFYVWLVALAAVEILVNGFVNLGNKMSETTLADGLETDSWLTAYESLEVADGERKSALMTYNYTPYSQTNWYSSMVNGYAIDAFDSLGLSHDQNIEYTYRRTTPLTALLFNVRYVLSNERGILPGYTVTELADDTYLYEADELLGMGFVTSADLSDWTGAGSAAANQNDFVKLATGGAVADDMFTQVDVGDTELTWLGADDIEGVEGAYTYMSNNDMVMSLTVEFTATEDMDLYVESYDSKLQMVLVRINGEIVADNTYVESSGFVHVGELAEGDEVLVRFFSAAKTGETGIKTYTFYKYNADVLADFIDYVGSNAMTSVSYDGATMTGSISSDKDGLFYLALPYSAGYTVYVDGTKVDTYLVGTGLMAAEITAGEHTVEVTYHTPYLRLGAILSLLGIAVLILLKRRGKALPVTE